MPRALALGLALALALTACGVGQRPALRTAGRLGRVLLFRPAPPPRAFVFLFSGGAGFGGALEEAARALAAGGAAVVGVDLSQYLRGLGASADGCHYVVAELEALSQALQRELGFAGYQSPVLAGVGAGGTLAYAALAQAPAATLGGAVAVDAAPALATRVPLCAGAPASAAPEGGFAYAPREELPAPFRAAADERIDAALAPLLAREEGAPAASLAGLPITLIPSPRPGALAAVIWSGDGGWRDLDKTIGGLLAERGVPVVGVDSLRYFWRPATPEGVARDLAAILASARARWGTQQAILVGYSFGAGILPFAYNRLPEAERARVVQLSLLGLEPTAPFEFHVSGWLGAEFADARPVLPELQRIEPQLVQCVYGEEEPNSLCRAPELAASERVRTRGGHHFDGDYAALAAKILAGAERRAAARGEAQRATRPVTPPETSAATSVSTKAAERPPGEAR
jgi:type IV secretory pathway VirJ component